MPRSIFAPIIAFVCVFPITVVTPMVPTPALFAIEKSAPLPPHVIIPPTLYSLFAVVVGAVVCPK